MSYIFSLTKLLIQFGGAGYKCTETALFIKMLPTSVSSAYWFCIIVLRDICADGEGGVGRTLKKSICLTSCENQMPLRWPKSNKWSPGEFVSDHNLTGRGSHVPSLVVGTCRLCQVAELLRYWTCSKARAHCCAVCIYSEAWHCSFCTVPFLSYILRFLYMYKTVGCNLLLNLLLVLQCKLAHLCLASFSLKFIFNCAVSLYLMHS